MLVRRHKLYVVDIILHFERHVVPRWGKVWMREGNHNVTLILATQSRAIVQNLDNEGERTNDNNCIDYLSYRNVPFNYSRTSVEDTFFQDTPSVKDTDFSVNQGAP